MLTLRSSPTVPEEHCSSRRQDYATDHTPSDATDKCAVWARGAAVTTQLVVSLVIIVAVVIAAVVPILWGIT